MKNDVLSKKIKEANSKVYKNELDRIKDKKSSVSHSGNNIREQYYSQSLKLKFANTIEAFRSKNSLRKIEKKKAEIDSYAKKIMNLEGVNSEIHLQIVEAEELLKEKNNTISKMTENVDFLEEALEKNKMDLFYKKSAIEDSNKKIEELAKINNKLEVELKNISEENSDGLKEIAKNREIYKRLLKEEKELKEKVNDFELKIVDEKEKLSREVREKSGLDEKITLLKKRKKEQVNVLDSLKDDQESLNFELEKLNRRIEEYQVEMGERSELINKEKELLKFKKEKEYELRTKASDYEGKIHILNGDLERLQSEIEDENLRLAKVEAEASERSFNFEAITNEISDADRRLNALKLTITSSEKKESLLKSEIKEKGDLYNQLLKDLDAKNISFLELEEKIKNLVIDKKEKGKRVGLICKNISNLDKELRKMISRKEFVEKSIDEVREKTSSFELDLEGKRKDLVLIKGEILSKEKEAESLNKLFSTLHEEQVNKERDYRALLDRREKMSQENSNLKDKVLKEREELSLIGDRYKKVLRSLSAVKKEYSLEEERLQGLQSKSKELESLIDEKEKEACHLSEKVISLRKTVEVGNTKINDMNIELKNLVNEVDEKIITCENIDEEILRKKKAFAEISKKHKLASVELDAMKNELNEKRDNLEGEVKLIKRVSSVYDEVLHEKNELDRKINKIDIQITSQENTLKSKEREIAKLNEYNYNITNTIKDKNENLLILKEKISSSDAKIKVLSRNCAGLEEENKALTNSILELDGKSRKCKTNLDKHEKMVNERRSEKRDLINKKEDIDKKISNFPQLLSKIKEDYDKEYNEIKNIESSIKELKSEIANNELEKKEMFKNQDELSKKKLLLLVEYEMLNEKVNTSHLSLETNKLSQLKKECFKLEQEINNKKNIIEGQEKDARNSEKELDTLSIRLEELKNYNHKLDKDIKKNRSKIVDIQSTIFTLNQRQRREMMHKKSLDKTRDGAKRDYELGLSHLNKLKRINEL